MLPTVSDSISPPAMRRLAPRIALGRAMRAEARELVAARGALAEAAAWCSARAPHLSLEERAYREGVAFRVSRMFAFVGVDRRH